MEIKAGWPPNIQAIREKVNPTEHNVFAYHPYVYIPSGKPITQDVALHEEIHLKQQEQIGVQKWWRKWLDDVSFRAEQEIEGYAAQYAYARKVYTRNHADHILTTAALGLSSPMYGNLGTYHEIEKKIKLKAKQYATPG